MGLSARNPNPKRPLVDRVGEPVKTRSLARTGGLLIDACLKTASHGNQANAQLAGSSETLFRDCDERLRLTSIQIPTINAASIPMTGDKSIATSRPIATVTTSHQKPKPRSLPIVAMNRDLIKRAGDVIWARNQPARGNKDLIKRAEDLIWARTQLTALESLPRSQRNGMNNRERLPPRSFFRARPSSSLTEGVLGFAGLLVFVVAVFMRFLRSAARRARWRGFPSMLAHGPAARRFPSSRTGPS